MQFVIIAKDGETSEYLEKRLRTRELHLHNMKAYLDKIHIAAATLNDDGKMNGSVIIAEFDDEEELEEWLMSEPYVKNDVWQHITVIPCKIAPIFTKE